MAKLGKINSTSQTFNKMRLMLKKSRFSGLEIEIYGQENRREYVQKSLQNKLTHAILKPETS